MKKTIIISVIAIITCIFLTFIVHMAFSYRDMKQFQKNVIPLMESFNEAIKAKNNKEAIHYYDKLDSLYQNLDNEYYVGYHDGETFLKEIIINEKSFIDSLKKTNNLEYTNLISE